MYDKLTLNEWLSTKIIWWCSQVYEESKGYEIKTQVPNT